MSNTNQPPPKKTTPTPQNHLTFDSWNSCATGHQRADSSTGTAWRRTREEKLARQFNSASGDCTDSLGGVTSLLKEEKGEWVWAHTKNRGESRDPGQRDIRSMMRVGKRSRDVSDAGKDQDSSERKLKVSKVAGLGVDASMGSLDELLLPPPPPSSLSAQVKDVPQVFKGVTVYINSTYHPGVSDHYLKRLLTMHGAAVSLSLSRKVSHVIVAKPNTGPGMGSGGGLAASKLQKEISRGGWKGIKIVFVEWALESIEAGKRLSEARFAMEIMPKGQRSVLSFTGI
ncbi:hypothetical protein F9C07_1889165 [Aspergillus flavus]|uniref:Uncharacterized protein n=5 Tax=Aspergillus subgen. Circumdati TaxID=2720871 RepID=B8NBX9_ASPFN|nr:unnamed protein product [Aspergillus oryzae RIB40]XP_041150563.1 uncharacterized protein G4B84_011051 [Aspergillus flavus NRRL3357]EIT77429.1 hypothetical protein Ao3042_06412 [Aspergillus oryzae 3.042]KAB8240525.1 hypothetical protein BDV35DRAFT_401799 [Aspergillus flavus]KDE82515.1 hypothetical protein AO1008_09026 [Aspergillus oryzae 100-8]KOC11221.1 hypothetical protein AFLA70_446g000941 [Aspergillus flavus AF70]OOO07273.1 BRCT domain protein [Aspergillus oryzae]|eukprot:EIT77429.1 hypothetical protein Ao3042_06412 [Aspergillus oryzae 3.042]